MNGSLDSSLNTSGSLTSSANLSTASLTLSNSGAVSEFGEGLTSTPPQDRTGRRPFLKVVVLYASDSRVLRYAKEVQTQFLDAGVDVYLQIDLDNVNMNGASGGAGSSLNSSLGISSSGGKDNEIKTENLAEIITSSTSADFLIVIGDRNMKNQSCQVKKRGKLVEMDVYDMVRAIWNEWAPYQADFDDLDVKLSASATIERLSATQLYIILQRFPPQVSLEEALKRAREAVDEIKTFGKTPSGNSKTKKQAAFPSLMTASLLTGSTVIFDEKQGAKFQTAQKNLIRLHKQILAVRAHILELPESKTEENFIINQEQFGHHVGPDYRPQQALTGQISPALRSRLIDLITQTIITVEQFGADLATYGAPLWAAYNAQINGVDGETLSSSAPVESLAPTHASTVTAAPANAANRHQAETSVPIMVNPSSLPVPALNEWSCLFCTSFNSLHLKECTVCGNSRVPNANTEEGAWETAGEKKARKKREAAAAEATAAALAASATPAYVAQPAIPAGPRVVPIGFNNTTPQILTKPAPVVPAATATAANPVAVPSQTTVTQAVATPTAASIVSASGNHTGSSAVAHAPPATAPVVAPISTTATATSTSAPPKKKLLDPIPGLAAAKQAAKTTTPKDKSIAPPGTPPQAVATNVPYTSPNSTYSSIVSGNAIIAPPTASQDTSPFPPLAALQPASTPVASDANVDAKSTLNEIFGSGAHHANSTASVNTNVSAASPAISAAPVLTPTITGSLPSQTILPSPGVFPLYVPTSGANASASLAGVGASASANNGLPPTGILPSPYYYNLNGSNELSYPMKAFPAGVPKSSPQAPLETPMADLFERWKQQTNNGTQPASGSPWGTVSSSQPGPANNKSANNNQANGNVNGVPVVMRTPTKNNNNGANNNGANNNGPHTPTFTTPFKGNAASRYGPPPSPMHLPSMNHHHNHHNHSNGNHHHHHHHQHGQGSSQQQHQQSLAASSPAVAVANNPNLSQVIVPLMAPHYEDFVQAEPKIGVKNPCWYCGEESTVECNLCPKVGLETFFCSGQHQAYIWKFHVRTCHPVSPTLAASFEKDGYHPPTQQSYGYGDINPILPPAPHQRRDSNFNSMPRYPSPGGRHKYT